MRNLAKHLSLGLRRTDQALVKLLLASDGVNLNSRDYLKRTPISWAAANGHTEVIVILLENGGLNPDLKDIFGRTPLSYAAGNGHHAVVALLLARHDVELDARDNLECTPLSWAAQNKHLAVVEILMASNRVNPDWDNSFRETPRGISIEKGYIDMIGQLLASVAVGWREQSCPHLTRIEALQARGDDAEAGFADSYGRALLWCAAACGRVKMVETLSSCNNAESFKLRPSQLS